MFSRQDMWAKIPEPGRLPLVLDPVIGNVRFEKVLIDSGSSLNILFFPAWKELEMEFSELTPYQVPFWGVMPDKPSYPLGKVSLAVELGTPQHFRVEWMDFIVADFDGAYHAIIGRPGLCKLMVVPHYRYLVLNLPTEKGILSLRSNVLTARSAETQSFAAAESKDIKHQLAKTKLVALEVQPMDLDIPGHSARRASTTTDNHEKIRLTDNDPSKTALIGTSLDPK